MTGTDKSAMELGLSSMNSWLSEIYNETVDGNRILMDIFDTIINGTTFDRTQPVMNANKIKSNGSGFDKQIYLTVRDIRDFLYRRDGPHERMKMRDRPEQQMSPVVNNIQNNLYIDKMPDKKAVKDLTKLFVEINKFFSVDIKKLERMDKFFTSFGNTLQSITPAVWKFSAGILFMASSLIVLGYISLTSLLKLALILPLLGFGLGQFFGILAGSLKHLNWFKTYFFLKMLPALFEKIGLSILYIAIGLLLFEAVGWEPMFKFVGALGMMAVIFRTMMDKRGNFLGTQFILALAVGIWILASRLEALEGVKWNNIFKLAVFIASLGAAVFVYTKLNGSSNIKMNPLTIIAIALFMIALSFTHFRDVAWSSIFKLTVFIAGLGLALSTGGFDKPMKASPMILLSIGVLAMSYSFKQLENVKIGTLLAVIAIIAVLGAVINRIMDSSVKMKGIKVGKTTAPSGMIGFAFGIGLLVLALYAFNDVPFGSVMKGVTFILLLGLAMQTFPKTKHASLFGFAFGLGLMVLAILAFNELPFWAMAKMLIFVAVLGLTLRFFYKDRPSSMVSFAFGLGLMVLAMYAMIELPFWAMIKTLVFLGVLGLVLKLFTKSTMINMLGLAGGLLALGVVFAIINNTTTNTWAMVLFTTFIVVIGVLVIMMAALSPLIKIGSIALLLLSASLFVAAIAFRKISNTDIKFSNIFAFIGAVSVLTLTFAILAIPLVVAGIGALLFIVVGLASIIGAEAIYAVSKTKINHDNVAKFTDVVKTISMTFAKNILWIALAVVPAAMFIVIALSVVLTMTALYAMNKIEINPESVNKFQEAVKTIIKTYDKMSVIQLGKTAIKAGLLLPVFATTYLAAKTLEKINNLDIQPARVSTFRESFAMLVETVTDTIDKYKDKLKNVEPGLKAVMQIVNISSKLATVVQQMADLKFNEYEVVNGQLVLKSQRQLTKDDFLAVGTNIGTLVEALSAPLASLGTNSSTFMIGNKSIANPFKANTHLKGLDFIKRMGDSYTPLMESIALMANSDMNDSIKANNVANSMMMMVMTYKSMLNDLEVIKFKNAIKVIEVIKQLNTTFAELTAKPIQAFNSATGIFIERFSSDDKWRKIKANVTFMRKEFEGTAKAINSIDINKAKAFENNLKLLVDKSNAQSMAEILRLLQEMFNLLSQQNAIQQQMYVNQVQQNAVQQTVQEEHQIVQPQKENQPPYTTQEQQIMELLSGNLDNFGGLLASINQKLAGTLKVKSVGMANSV